MSLVAVVSMTVVLVVVVVVKLHMQRNYNNLDTTDPISTGCRQHPVLNLQHTHIIMLDSVSGGHNAMCVCASVLVLEGKGSLS
jgi:hypothetical protein